MKDGLALAGLLQADPLRADVQEEAGLQLAGVVAGVVEGLPRGVGGELPEVDDGDQHAEPRLHVADDRLELVAAVRVEQHEAVDALRGEGRRRRRGSRRRWRWRG